MAKLRKCRECSHDVSKKAKTCPNCGIKKPGARQYSLWKTLAVFAFVYALWSVLPDTPPMHQPNTQLTTASNSTPSAANNNEREQTDAAKLNTSRVTNAKIYAEQTVRKSLKSPSGASFSGYPDTRSGRLKVFDDRYVVSGWVDAENSFGATIRSDYQVVVEFAPGSADSIRVITFDLFDR